MALRRKKKKTSRVSSTKRTRYNTESRKMARMIGVIILLFVAVFIALSVFSFDTGPIGLFIGNAARMVFGTLSLAFPIVIVISIIFSLYYDDNKLNIKLYALITLYIAIICLVDSVIHNYGDVSGIGEVVNESIRRAQGSLGFSEEQFSGGAVGTAIVFLLNKAIGKTASIVAFSFITLIALISTFGTVIPMKIAGALKAVFSFIFGLPSRLRAKNEEDKKIAQDNEKILKEAYEKSRSKNLQVSFDNSFSDTRLVLEPLTPKKRVFDTTNVTVTPSDIEKHLFKAGNDSSEDRPQSHLLKELRKKSINEVLYEEKEKGNENSEFFYTSGMKPIEELDSIVFPKPKETVKESAPIFKNEYDIETDSIYQDDNKSFASGLEDLKRTEVVDKENSKKTISNIEKDGIELKNNTLSPDNQTRRIRKRVKKYKFPPLNLLNKNDRRTVEKDSHLNEKANILVETLKTFGIGATLLNITVGPAVTRYELKPDIGVKISKILSLENDLQLALAASSLKIEAPIPGKAAIGIEIANDKSSSVLLGDIIATPDFRNSESKLTVAIGKDISGKAIVTDLRKMPHLLIAGATGSGKSVCVNSLITSLIYKSSPEDVRMIMIDPKVVELQIYNGIPHLLVPVVTNPKKAAGALNWAVSEMTRRYNLIQERRVRDIESYNQAIAGEIKKITINDENEAALEQVEKLPYIVIIIDEFADLMMVASKEVENAIMRIAQLARACGIYLVIATQRPSVNVISGSIKTNVPSRISFSVASGVDSQTILDRRGAEKLLGHGDMLYFPTGYPEPVRVQGCYVSEDEIFNIVEYVRDDDMVYDEVAEKVIDKGISMDSSDGGSGGDEKDDRFIEAGRLIVREQNASIGMIQRKFAMGFNRAARIIDQLESEGVISKQDGKKPREVLMTIEEFDAKFGG